MKPLVSIMIPCYNHEKYIGDCLESILVLNYPRIEVLILDDASEDGSVVAIETYRERLEKKAERVVIEVNPVNLGICANCNKLFEMAEGEYYMFLASDDFLLADGISILVNHFEENPDCNVVHGDVIKIDENDSFTNYAEKRARPRVEVPSGYHLTDRILAGGLISAPAAMISRRTREKYGVYSEEYVFEDWEYWLRISVDGRIDYVNKMVVAYRVLSDSACHFSKKSNEKRKRFLEDQIRLFESYQGYASRKTINKFYRMSLINAYLCNDGKMVKLVRRKMNANQVGTFGTLVYIAAYKTGMYRMYQRIRKLDMC